VGLVLSSEDVCVAEPRRGFHDGRREFAESFAEAETEQHVSHQAAPEGVIPSVRRQPLDHFLRTVWATANRDVLGAVEAAAEKLSLKVLEAAKRFRRRGLDRPSERVELVQPHSVGVDLPY
jgi:hypothetical protein